MGSWCRCRLRGGHCFGTSLQVYLLCWQQSMSESVKMLGGTRRESNYVDIRADSCYIIYSLVQATGTSLLPTSTTGLRLAWPVSTPQVFDWTIPWLPDLLGELHFTVPEHLPNNITIAAVSPESPNRIWPPAVKSACNSDVYTTVRACISLPEPDPCTSRACPLH